jgi:hypothetical protein
MEVQDCLDGIFNILGINPSLALLRQPEIDQILCMGEAPSRWTRPRHFPPLGDPAIATIPTCCGPWHNGAGHFVTFYLCPEYWSILDPLEGAAVAPARMQHRLHDALHESFHSRGLPTPPLPPFRSLPQIATQRDNPRPLWSCGTFAMSTTLHLLLGGTPPHSLPTQFITRDHMLALHRALLE